MNDYIFVARDIRCADPVKLGVTLKAGNIYKVEWADAALHIRGVPSPFYYEESLYRGSIGKDFEIIKNPLDMARYKQAGDILAIASEKPKKYRKDTPF